MAKSSKRRRLNDPGNLSPISTSLSQESVLITDDDKREWKGFCEIESEPAFFNAILKDFGVRGVKVQEVVSLERDFLALLPQPVYGLIFLFKWREEDPGGQEQSCPEEVWFANQTVDNACASVALLNIVNNVSSLELGDSLQQFKDFTATFTPALRGDAIGNFDHVRSIHNSFARKMDILNADLQLKNNAATRRKSKSHTTEDDEASFHFIAFVPVEGKVWKLDGLERQPQKLSQEISEVADWTSLAAPEIQSRMAQYEEGQIEFAVLSLVKDPISNLLAALAENINSGAVILSHLDNLNTAWMDEVTLPLECEALRARFMVKSHEHYGIDQVETNPAVETDSFLKELCAQDVPQLVKKLQRLVEDQATLKSSIKTEKEANRLEEEQATSRRNDQGQLAKGLLEVINRMEKMDLFLDGI